jgi:hypothetical protein
MICVTCVRKNLLILILGSIDKKKQYSISDFTYNIEPLIKVFTVSVRLESNNNNNDWSLLLSSLALLFFISILLTYANCMFAA